MAAQQFKDGDTFTDPSTGITYTRVGGQWHAPQSGGNSSVIPAPAAKPELVPGHPNIAYHPDSGTTTPVPGIPAPAAPAPNFVPGKPGYVVTGDPSHPQAVQLPGLPGGGVDSDAAQRAKAIQQYNYAKQLEATADQLSQLSLKGPGATSGIEGLKDFLPLPDNKAFNTAANKSRGIVGQTLGFTGGQLNTPQEAEKAVGPFIPEASDFDSVIQQKIQSMRDLAKSGKENAIQTLGGIPDANGIVHPDTGANGPAPATNLPGSGDRVDLATGKTRDQVDPTLKVVGHRVGIMLANGSTPKAIKDYLAASGVNPADTNVDAALSARDTPEGRAWFRANPGKAYPLGSAFYTKQVPMTAARSLFNKTAATDVGGNLAAGLVAAGNSVTGNRGAQLIGSINGDPEAATAGMDLLRGQHPLSSFAGDMAGQMALEGAAGGIPGVGKLLASPWGRRGADALFGAYSNPDNPLMGAGLGAGTGMFGRGVQKTLGHAATGIQDAGLQYLHSKGIPLTVGRIARGVGEISPTGPTNMADEFGKAGGGIEERLMGLPGLDAVIGTARQRGDRAFTQEAYRQIAPGVSGIGEDGLASAKAAETAAYGKLKGAIIPVDPAFDASLTAAETAATGLHRHAGDVADVIKDVRSQIASGGMTGEGFQSALQSVRAAKASLGNDVMGHKAAAILDGLDNEINGVGMRAGGTVASDLAEANAIHGRRKIIQTAAKGSPAQGAEGMISPKTLNQASIQNTTKFGGIDNALSANRPFHDLTKAGMGVMPNLTPDSGTAGRLQLYRALGSVGAGLGGGLGALSGDHSPQNATEGGGIGLGGGIALGALLSAPYSHSGQKIIQHALLSERPEVIQKIGQYLISRNPKYAGMFASAMGRDYAFQPEAYPSP